MRAVLGLAAAAAMSATAVTVSATAATTTTLRAMAYTALNSGSNGMAIGEIIIDEAKGHASLNISTSFGVIDGATPCSGSWASVHSERFNYSIPAAFWVASEAFIQPFDLNGVELETTYALNPSGWYISGAVILGRELYGIAVLGSSNATIVAVDIDSGNLRISPANAGNYITVPQCTAAIAPPAYSGSAKKGSYSFSTSVMANNNAVIATYDIGADKFITPDISYVGEIDAITPFLSAAGSPGMLAISTYNGSDASYLLAWGEDRSAEPEKLLTINNAYSAVDTGMAFDPTTHKAYALMMGPNTLLDYSIAVFDLSTHKPSAVYYPLKGSAAATYGWSTLAVASEIK